MLSGKAQAEVTNKLFFKIHCFKVQLLTASEPRLTKLKWIIK